MYGVDYLLDKRNRKTQNLLDAKWWKERVCLEVQRIVEVIILKLIKYIG
jgi:hypothetical protein